MATFHVGEQTHPAVLPQRQALESVGADTPVSRDETAHGHPVHMRDTGVEHGREETSRTRTRPAKRHPEVTTVVAEGAGREAHPVVFVLDKRGRPLQPTTPVRARKLLKQGRAVVARHTPFVIRLKDRVVERSAVDGVALRIDPGSKGTGIAVTCDIDNVDAATGETVTDRRGLYAVELTHRGSLIRKKMGQRAAYRRGRRTRNLRYRAPRFCNRTKREGWLAPSLRHRVDTTLSWVSRLQKFAPVTELHVELVSFDTHQLSAGGPLEGAEYQQGAHAGYESRQYLLEKWGRVCAYCGATGVPLQVEHIRPRCRGGSDRISNLTLACEPCNQAKGSRPIEEFLAGRPARLAKVLAQAQRPLRHAAVMNSTRWALRGALALRGLPLRAWSGGRTKYNRARSDLAKTHTMDALAVGDLPDGTRITRFPATVLVAAAAGRGAHARTSADKYGFPRLYLPRQKQFFGYQTGDLVRAVLPAGRYVGMHIGRVAVRATGRFNIRTADRLVQGIHCRYIQLLQRSDGYGYSIRKEEVVCGTGTPE